MTEPFHRIPPAAPRRRPAHGRGALARLLAGLWLVVHAAVVGGAPILDAGVEHGQVVAHWEDASDTSCPPRHDASACPLCQIASAEGRAPTDRPAALPALGRSELPPTEESPHPASHPETGWNASRAPPVA